MLRPILSTRKLIPVTLRTGNFLDLTDFEGCWPFTGVDYVNEGDEVDPPTLSYVNIIDDSVTGHAEEDLGYRLGVLLPLSAESVEVLQRGNFIQYRHPRWAHV